MDHFRSSVRQQTEVVFNEVLPRYIELYFHGKGMLFVRKLLHDLDNHSILDILTRGKPSSKSLKKARNVYNICPIKISLDIKKDAQGLILGQFQHEESYREEKITEYAIPTSYKTIDSVSRIVIYEGSFLELGISESDLNYKIFETIIHELIHFFESYLLKSEQVLSKRESHPRRRRRSLSSYSLKEAARIDDWCILVKLAKYLAIFIITAWILWVVL